MSFAREGLVFIIVAVLLATAGYALALSRRSWPLWLLAFGLTIVALWVAWFFRDPERAGRRGGGLVIAPADGRVVMITEVDEPAFLYGRAQRISIFMNVFSVHVNRYPVSGTVRFVHYNPGKFLNALRPESARENEQLEVRLQSRERPAYRFRVRQISGAIARRIVCWLKPGDDLAVGEKFGMIKLGSRTELILPAEGLTVNAKVGQWLNAGCDVIARYEV